MELTVTSTAFAAGATIPRRYTAEGENLSPPLAWSGVPAGTQSLAVLVEDPDAPSGMWVHWVLYNLPPETTALPEGVPTRETLESGAQQGIHTGRQSGYSGPYPPPGSAHRYYFRVYALDTRLALHGPVTGPALHAAMQGHILAEGELMGRYGR